jgi:APA family basic amino acid/polyamine antiporter
VPFVPIAGILINLSMMLALGWHNWVRLFVWLGIGLVIYAVYGRKRSALALATELSLGGASPGGRPLDR